MLSDSASLILSTKSTINPCTINAQKTAFTFNNIDMKNVMGEMWDKYDQFALKLVSYAVEGAVTTTFTQQGHITYNLRGLEWSNVIYETTGSNMNKEWVPVAYAFLTPASAALNPLIINTGWSFNFKKGNRYQNFEFALASSYFTNASEFGVFAAGNNFNNVEFHFLFEPVIPGKMNECAFYGFNSTPSAPSINSIKRIVSADRTEYSYPDFNMRRLCNLFWDKHDDFEIQMAMSSINGTGANTGDIRITPVQMSGLNFVNNGTKQSNDTAGLKLNTENALIGTIINPTTTNGYFVNMAYPVAPVQFKKDNDNVPLKIAFRNSENTGPTVAAGYTSLTRPFIQIAFFVKPIYGVEKATLNINPWGLTTTETNLGVRDTQYTTFTLKGIDMRKVCGSMWDKYDRFNIFLTQTTWFVGACSFIAAWNLTMEGLNFIPQLSLTNTQRQTQVAVMGSIETSEVTNEVRSQGLMGSVVTSFYKGNDVVNLTLTAVGMRPPTDPLTSITPLTGNFTFTIVGVPKDEEQAKEFTQNQMKV
jgi:hypothetical protein